MGSESDAILHTLMQKALALRRTLKQNGIDIDIAKAKEILAQVYEVASWQDLISRVPQKDEPFKDDLYVVLSYAVKTLANIAFQSSPGAPSKCTLLVDRITKGFHGIQINSPWRTCSRAVTLNSHTLDGVGHLFALEILNGLAQEGIESFGKADFIADFEDAANSMK